MVILKLHGDRIRGDTFSRRMAFIEALFCSMILLYILCFEVPGGSYTNCLLWILFGLPATYLGR